MPLRAHKPGCSLLRESESAYIALKRSSRHVTIKDIAARSGISSATISRVLNHPELVRGPLRARVEAALQTHGYVAHGAARSLASRRTRTMGAVVPTVDSAHFAKLVDGMQQEIHDHGFQMLLASSNYSPEREALEVRALLERGVDAMLLVGSARRDDVYAMLRSRGVPFVNTCLYVPDAPWPMVGWDNVREAARVADYLLDIGHRRFGIIAGITRDNDRAEDRRTGFLAALARRGVTIAPSCIIERVYTVTAGRAAMAALLRVSPRPTAVMCGNDILAIGALQECQWSGVDVPGEVSITGFDDIEMAAHCFPGITTVRSHARRIGETAAQILLRAVAGESGTESVHLDLELVVRGTTAPPADSPMARTGTDVDAPLRGTAHA